MIKMPTADTLQESQGTPSSLDWIAGMALQYASMQAAILRGDNKNAQAAEFWLKQIAAHNWHNIITACKAYYEPQETPR